jgi:hypothetical protein
MSSPTSSIHRFGAYLQRAQRRERWRHGLRFIALLCLTLLLVTAIGAWTGLFRGFTPVLTNAIRFALLAVALILLFALLWRPLVALRRDQGASLVENADAAFDGRVRTYLDTRARNPDQPFLTLLAQDALSVARQLAECGAACLVGLERQRSGRAARHCRQARSN